MNTLFYSFRKDFFYIGEMDEKYIELFTSGKSRLEIEEELIKDDEFFLSNFPQVFRDALQVCCD